MKIAVILGTRPEIIKMSSVIRDLDKIGLDYFILHTGQHYSYNMDKVFFDQLFLPEARYNLEVGSCSHAEQTGKMMMGIEKILQSEGVDIILVEGDTNTVLAGALCARKMGIEVGHIEAGLRSYDKRMPEETNRILTDHISDYLFAPTEVARGNLLTEGIDEEKIYVTGNTIVDAVHHCLEIANNTNLYCITKEEHYVVLTLHRPENVDNPKRLRNIINGIELVTCIGKKVICPLHPRTRKRIQEYDIHINNDDIIIIDPIDYLMFLKLESKADLILTDSGGVQEEACILGVPCVTLRDNTERPETIQVGANVLAGSDPKTILEKALMMTAKGRNWKNPFGDGQASKRIIDIICSRLVVPQAQLRREG